MKILMRLLIAFAFVFALPATLAAQYPAGFPHAKHAKLFPTCAGCHAGVPTGDAARVFPAPASCASCHDGTVQPRVAWAPPVRRGVGLLVFSHPTHTAKSKDVACVSCHTADGTTWMNVSKAAPDRCISCHAHDASEHLDDKAKCTTCHRPLTAATALTDAKISALPKPASHSQPKFISSHGAAASGAQANCATCHARESCARCHVDASRSSVIQAMGSDARVARTVAGKAPVYPTPADHNGTQFVLGHGAAAKNATATCATCHARPSCQTCHIGDGAKDVIRKLPAGGGGSAAGVQLRRTNLIDPASGANGVSVTAVAWVPQPHQQDTTRHRVRVHPNDFQRAHGRVAASGETQCAGCHTRKFCADCHAGEKISRRYHPSNFVSTHAPQAYGRETNCSSCHNTAAFCRDCHTQAGLAVTSSTNRSPVFHNARPLWLLQHGRAARQDLMTCTTCHQQTYCMQCHSQLGSRISPHGPDFNAARMASRNSQICLACHFKNPLGK